MVGLELKGHGEIPQGQEMGFGSVSDEAEVVQRFKLVGLE